MSLPSIQRVLLESFAANDQGGRFVMVNGIQTYYKLAIPQEHQILLQNQLPLPNEPHKPVIVCLHHMLGNQYTWRCVAQPLADATGYHVISYDRTAFGFTERPTHWEENNNPYTQEASVDFVSYILERLGYGEKKVILIGVSSGATISCAFAIRYPYRVHSVIVLGASLRPEDQGPPQAARHILASTSGRLFLKATLYQYLPLSTLYHNTAAMPEWETVIKPCCRVPLTLPNFYESFSWLMEHFQPLEVLDHKHILQQVPICYIVGEHDKFLNPEVHKEVFAYLKSDAPENAIIEFKKIGECGHLPQDENPQGLLPVVIDFIRRVGT